MMENYEHDDDLMAAGTVDRCERWQDVSANLLGNFPAAGGCLDDESLAFYAPAVMCWELRYGRRFELESPAEMFGRRFNHVPAIASLFSPAQQDVIRRCLQHIARR